jgi:hypothetical protein
MSLPTQQPETGDSLGQIKAGSTKENKLYSSDATARPSGKHIWDFRTLLHLITPK